MDIRRDRTRDADRNYALVACLSMSYRPRIPVPNYVLAEALGFTVPTVLAIRRWLVRSGRLDAMVVRGLGGGVLYELTGSPKVVA